MKPTYREERSLLDLASAPLLVGFLWEGIVRCGRRILTFVAEHPIITGMLAYCVAGAGGAVLACFASGFLRWRRRRSALTPITFTPACQHQWEFDHDVDGRLHWRCRLCGTTGEG